MSSSPKRLHGQKAIKFVFVDYFLILLILTSSFAIYLHHLFPDTQIWNTSLFYLKSHVAGSIQVFMYLVLLKITPIVLFCTWYVTESHWRRYSILIPVVFLLFQVLSQIFSELNLYGDHKDVFALVYAFSVIVLLIVFDLLLKYYKRNLMFKYNIDSENFYQIPGTSSSKKRILNIWKALGQENLNRTQLNAIYREYSSIGDSELGLQSHYKNSGASWSRKFFLELFFFILVASTPILFSLYKIIEPGIVNAEFYGFKFHAFGFVDIYTFLWVVNSKLLIIIPVTLWFFVNRYWWKYFLLFPFAISMFQLLEIFKRSSQIDGKELITILPFVILISLILVFLTRRVRNYVMFLEFYTKMEFRINKSIRQLSLDKESSEKDGLKIELTRLMQEHKQFTPEEYLKRLKEIKAQLEALKQEGS